MNGNVGHKQDNKQVQTELLNNVVVRFVQFAVTLTDPLASGSKLAQKKMYELMVSPVVPDVSA